MKPKPQDEQAKVIKFDPDRMPVKVRRAKFCQHPYIWVEEESRMLRCRKCDAVIDPFDFMFQWACKDRALELSRAAFEREIERLRKITKELRREEINTRARLRRLNK